MVHQLLERGTEAFNQYGKLKGYQHGWQQHYLKHRRRS